MLTMTTLPERLAEVMADLGLKGQKELADFCEVTEGLVTQWFQGTTRLGPKPLKAFGRKTNYSLDWLTDGRLPKRRGQEPVLIERKLRIDYESIRRMVEPILKEHGLAYADLVSDEEMARANIAAKLSEQKAPAEQSDKRYPTQVRWTKQQKSTNKNKKAGND